MLRKIARNAGRVLSNPAMTAAYARWRWDRMLGKASRVALPGGGWVSGFSTFSGYWSFRPVKGTEYRLLQRMTKNAAVLGDIGANLGAFTIAMARLAPSARILSFEPAPSTFRLLETNVRENQLANVTCIPVAVCDEIGTVRFTNQSEGSANNSLIAAQCLTDAPTVDVPATTLDRFCEDQGIASFDFLKIDAEGAEPRIILGAQKLFRSKRIKAALIEICKYWLEAAGSNALSLADQIRGLGYDLYAIADDGGPGQRIGDAELRHAELINALLLPV